MFYLILVFVMFAAAHIILNWLLIERYAVYINHLIEAIIAGLVHISALVLFYATDLITFSEVGISVIVWPFVRWLIHDIALNLMRGKPIFYYGTGPKPAFTDVVLAFFVQRGVPVWLVKCTALSAAWLIALLIFQIF